MCAHREIVKRIDMWGIDMVFVVGGNGGNAGAAAIQDQCLKDGVICNIVGVPKSIDNDILVVCYTLHACVHVPCIIQQQTGAWLGTPCSTTPATTTPVLRIKTTNLHGMRVW